MLGYVITIWLLGVCSAAPSTCCAGNCSIAPFWWIELPCSSLSSGWTWPALCKETAKEASAPILKTGTEVRGYLGIRTSLVKMETLSRGIPISHIYGISTGNSIDVWWGASPISGTYLQNGGSHKILSTSIDFYGTSRHGRVNISLVSIQIQRYTNNNTRLCNSITHVITHNFLSQLFPSFCFSEGDV